MRAIAQQVHGFAGVAGSGPRAVDVYTTDLNIDQDALRTLLPSQVSDFDSDWEIRLIEAKYDFVQLSDWYSRVYYDVHTVDGVVWTDIYEAGSWISIAVATEEGRTKLEEIFEAADVPEDAYKIQIEQAVPFG